MKQMELRDYQKEALTRLGSGKILHGGVGSGKSLVAVHYYLQAQAPKPVYVITTAKKRDSLDWNRVFAQHAIGTTAESTVAGVLTVDSWNNIGKYIRCKNAFFIFDEQRLVGSGGWVKSFLKIATCNDWILLSGTPGDTWLEYIPVFVANGFFTSRTDFKTRHVIYKSYTKFPTVDRYVDVSKLEALRNQILVYMPYSSHTTRHIVRVGVEHNKELISTAIKTRWNSFAEQPMRGSAELYAVMRKIVNSDESRLRALQQLSKKHPKLIVFYNFDYELVALRTITGVEIAEWNGHKHQQIPDSDAWLYLVQYTSGAEGWECIDTDAMVFYSQTYSYKIYEQAHGRIDRLNTPFVDLYYYHFLSTAVIDRSIRRALDHKRSFNESDLSDFR
jgi:superfamily II DNA or RNA helicase